MSEKDQTKTRRSISEWTRETYDKAVRELIANDLIDVEVFEARPTWALEDQIVIGQVREVNSSTMFRWVICGQVPTDHISSDVAATPRDVARHFSMKWQLDGERLAEPSVAADLAQKAEFLYELTENDSLWQ